MEPNVKACCAFYENDLVRLLLGESLHPGGLALTRQLGERIDLDESDHVLEIASGSGVSGTFLAGTFGCQVTEIDLSAKLVLEAAKQATGSNLRSISLSVAAAENLPFRDGAFSAIISECSICTFPNKSRALSEAFRVLKSGGRVGISDPVVHGEIAGPLNDLIGQVLCLAGASEPSAYVDMLKANGFENIRMENRVDAIREMMEGIRKRLFLAELFAGVGKLQVKKETLIHARRLLAEVKKYVDHGKVGYAIVTGEKC